MLKKGMTIMFLVAAMTIGTLAGCSSTGSGDTAETEAAETAATETQEAETGAETAESEAADTTADDNAGGTEAERQGELLYVVVNQGFAQITDEIYDKYYREGNAVDGVEAIIESGQYFVNGMPVPVEEEEFQVNEFTRLQQTEDGWYSYANRDEGTTFEEVRLGFVKTLSRMNGLTEELYCDDGSGYVTRIETTIYECTVADKIIDHGDGTYSIDRGNYELALDEIGDQPDINDVVFPAENFDLSIQEGDVCLFWKDTEGWHLKRAISIEGHLTEEVTENEDGTTSTRDLFNGVEYGGGMLLSRAFMANQVRGGMYVPAHIAFGLEDVTITFWMTDAGGSIGYTSGEQASVSLERAIAYANADKENVVISTDGSDVDADTYWVTQEVMDTFDAAIETAQKVLDDADSTNLDKDMAIYNLYLATCASGESNDHQAETEPGFEHQIALGTK